MTNILHAGDTLYGANNQYLESENQIYRLIMQHDGNLVLYEGVQSVSTALWATNTRNLQPTLRTVRADMQADGNFVLYNATNIPAWASGTHMYPDSELVLQDDRNLVIYDRGGTPRWASNTMDPDYEQPSTIPIDADTGLQEVGWGKKMQTKATLYRNGTLMATTYTQNDNWTGGMRGRVVIVAVDKAGRAIWVSQIFECTTRCSVPDVSCAARGTDLLTENFPEPFGRYAHNIDIYQADGASFVDLRQKTIDAIRALKDVADVAQDLKKAIVDLYV